MAFTISFVQFISLGQQDLRYFCYGFHPVMIIFLKTNAWNYESKHSFICHLHYKKEWNALQIISKLRMFTNYKQML